MKRELWFWPIRAYWMDWGAPPAVPLLKCKVHRCGTKRGGKVVQKLDGVFIRVWRLALRIGYVRTWPRPANAKYLAGVLLDSD